MKYVLAGNYHEFDYLCRMKWNISPRNPSVYYIANAYNLRGRRLTPNDTLVYYGTYQERRDWNEIRDALGILLYVVPGERPMEEYW